jgi:hypothetical protein
MVGQLTETQIVYVLAGLSGADPRVVKRYRRGEQIRESVRERIELAARQLAQLQSAPPPAMAQS